MPMLRVSNVGNVNTRYLKGASDYVLEPSLVSPVQAGGFRFEGDAPKPFRYLKGPALSRPRGVKEAPAFYVGRDAERGGVNNISVIGTATARITSPAYLLLHMYSICAALPAKTTTAECVFVGSLPTRDYNTAGTVEALKAKLKGAHLMEWGGVEYSVTIGGVLLMPEPAADAAGFIFTKEGAPRAKEIDRKRLTLNIGGGTTEVGGRVGMDLVPGTEDGFKLGFNDAAEIARRLIIEDRPKLINLKTEDVIRAARARTYKLRVGGSELVDIRPYVQAGAEQIAPAVVASLPTVWEGHMATAEVDVAGGAGEDFFTAVRGLLEDRAEAVALAPDPVFSVLDGLVKFGRYKLNGRAA